MTVTKLTTDVDEDAEAENDWNEFAAEKKRSKKAKKSADDEDDRMEEGEEDS